MISKAETIVIPATIRAAASDDGAVLLDIEQGVCFSLNAVGLKIWELLEAALLVRADRRQFGGVFPRSPFAADLRHNRVYRCIRSQTLGPPGECTRYARVEV